MSIPNTPQGLREAAERAHNTRQPRTAALYTRKAEEIEEKDRRAAMSVEERAGEDLGRALSEMGQKLNRWIEAFNRGWESTGKTNGKEPQ